MKKYIILCVLAALVLSVGLAVADRPEKQAADVAPSNGHASVTIPAHAMQVAPGVFSLGTAIDNGIMVEGYAILRYKEAPGKPSGCNNDGVCQGWEPATCGDCSGGGEDPLPPETSTCYGFLAKGAKWKSVEPYIVNPANTRGVDELFVVDNLAMDIGKWEAAAGVDILGSGSATSMPLVADTVSTDGVNEVYFADIADEGVIGVTIIWGVFGGAPKNRQLVEWDMVFDQADFDWSATGEPDKMDFENIATHELGHAVGMGDLYDSACSDQTMYGYASNGETNKRSLEAGDITGVQALY